MEHLNLQSLRLNDNWMLIKYECPAIFVGCIQGIVVAKSHFINCENNVNIVDFQVGDHVIFPSECLRYDTKDDQLLVIKRNEKKKKN